MREYDDACLVRGAPSVVNALSPTWKTARAPLRARHPSSPVEDQLHGGPQPFSLATRGELPQNRARTTALSALSNGEGPAVVTVTIERRQFMNVL